MKQTDPTYQQLLATLNSCFGYSILIQTDGRAIEARRLTTEDRLLRRTERRGLNAENIHHLTNILMHEES